MITAKLNNLRTSPRKVRLVADLIRGMMVMEAEKQLRFSTKKASVPILKLLNSAIANAKQNAGLAKENLYIASIVVEAGRTLKRWRPRAMGRAGRIMKRTSHIILSLEQKGILKAEPEKTEKKFEILPQEETKVKKEPSLKTKSVKSEKPYATTLGSKKRIFGQQAEGAGKKMFRRKKI